MIACHFLSLLLCVPMPGADSSAEARAIRAARAAQNAAIVRGDATVMAQYWTEDVTVRRAAGGFTSGRAEYVARLSDTTPRPDRMVYVRTPATVRVSAVWPLAVEHGRWEGHLGTRRGAVVAHGEYTAQWIKRDGGWRIRGEVFALLGCTGVGCASDLPTSRLDQRGDAAAVRAARAAQNRAIIAGDTAGIGAAWTDDVSIRRGLGGMTTGRAAYLAMWTDTSASDARIVYLRHADSVRVHQGTVPIAFERGHWEGRAGGPDGAVLIAGEYGAQWVKGDGRWRIRGEVFVALTCGGAGCQMPVVP